MVHAIIFDVENLVFSARKDALIKDVYGRRSIAARVIDFIESLAGGIELSPYRHAALAVHEGLAQDTESTKSFRRGRSVFDSLLPLLSERGFKTTIVPGGNNAADKELFGAAQQIAENPDVDMVFLASGDGHDPFPQLVDLLAQRGKKVHIIVYDKVPASMKNMSVSFAAPLLRLEAPEKTMRERRTERFQARSGIPISSSQPLKNDERPLRTLYRDMLRRILQTPNWQPISMEPSESNKELIFLDVCELLLRHFGERCADVPFSRILGLISRDPDRHHLPIDGNGLHAILVAILDHTDIFKPIKAYSRNQNSSDLPVIAQILIATDTPEDSPANS